MDASELSEQLAKHIVAGEWSQAMGTLADAWRESSEFGTAICENPDYPGVWVRFKTRGYPFSLRRSWEEAKTDAEVMDIILPRIAAWNVPDVVGSPIALSTDGDRPASLIDNIDEPLIVWLISVFVRFWRRELAAPRKN